MKILYVGGILGSLSLITPNQVSQAELQVETAAEIEKDPVEIVHRCGMALLQSAGKGAGAEIRKLPALYTKASISKDLDFLLHMMAVIYVESHFQKEAKSDQEAYGLMQMTEIAVQDAVRRCNLKPVSMQALYDSYTNVKYGTCYLKKALEDASGDWTRALIIYNGGYQALIKYNKGDSIPEETANYVLKVHRALEECKAQ